MVWKGVGRVGRGGEAWGRVWSGVDKAGDDDDNDRLCVTAIF